MRRYLHAVNKWIEPNRALVVNLHVFTLKKFVNR